MIHLLAEDDNSQCPRTITPTCIHCVGLSNDAFVNYDTHVLLTYSRHAFNICKKLGKFYEGEWTMPVDLAAVTVDLAAVTDYMLTAKLIFM